MHSPQEEPVSPDVLVNNVGTLYTFCPLTLRAKEWIDEHVQDDAQWFGYALIVEHRYAWGLAQGIMARIEPPKPGSFETCLQAHMTNASRVFARQCRRFFSSRMIAAFRSTCDSAAKSSRDLSSVSNQCWTLVLCRVVVLGGLEPFVFVKSIFILFSFEQKNRQTQTGLAFGNRCVYAVSFYQRAIAPSWWKARRPSLLIPMSGLCDREQMVALYRFLEKIPRVTKYRLLPDGRVLWRVD